MKRLSVFILVAMGILVFGASCSLSNSGTSNPQNGAFLVANISPDAPPLTLNANGQQTPVQALASGTYTPYYQAVAGSYTFAFYDSASATSPVISNTLNISANTNYSYFVIDSFKRVKTSFVQDNLFVPNTDSVYIRFFNFSPNAGEVSLFETTSDSTFYPSRFFDDQETNQTYTGFNRIKAGIYSFQLLHPDNSVLASKNDTLSGGHIYTIFVKGSIGGTGSQAVGFGQIQNY